MSTAAAGETLSRAATTIVRSSRPRFSIFSKHEPYGALTIQQYQGDAATIASEMVDRLVSANSVDMRELRIFYTLSFNRRVYYQMAWAYNPSMMPFLLLYALNCAIEQLTSYQNNGDLYINGDIWRTLDEQNRAALYLHEAVYKLFRDRGYSDSRRARKIVGHLLAGFQFEPVFPENPDLDCIDENTTPWSPKTRFQVQFVGESARLYLISIDSQPVASRRVTSVSRAIFDGPEEGGGRMVYGYTKSNFENSEIISLESYSHGLQAQVRNVFGEKGAGGAIDLDIIPESGQNSLKVIGRNLDSSGLAKVSSALNDDPELLALIGSQPSSKATRNVHLKFDSTETVGVDGEFPVSFYDSKQEHPRIRRIKQNFPELSNFSKEHEDRLAAIIERLESRGIKHEKIREAIQNGKGRKCRLR